jgi:hypothetical protein
MHDIPSIPVIAAMVAYLMLRRTCGLVSLLLVVFSSEFIFAF